MCRFSWRYPVHCCRKLLIFCRSPSNAIGLFMAISLVLGASPKAGAGAGAGAAVVAILARVFLGSFRSGFGFQWSVGLLKRRSKGRGEFTLLLRLRILQVRSIDSRSQEEFLKDWLRELRVLSLGSGLVEERVCSI